MMRKILSKIRRLLSRPRDESPWTKETMKEVERMAQDSMRNKVRSLKVQ